jgi:sugar lactone lactonase YvrE
MKMRPIVRLVLAGIAGLALVVPMTGAATAGSHHLRDRIELPDGFQPEGITIGPGPIGYFGSRVDGDIYAADLKTGKGRVISQGPGAGFPAIGLKSDQRGLLYVSGGTAGTGRVVRTRDGATIRTYQFTTGNSFVNDVVLSKRAAWFTDSRNPQLYVVPRGWRGKPAPATAFRTLKLTGDFKQTGAATDVNLNGIARTPDRRALLVVQSNTGLLFRVNPRTGRTKRVDLGSTLLTNGDGLLVKGRTLYAVQNRLNKVAVVKLNRAGTAGRLMDELTSPDFDVPTTVAAYRGSLFLPNARFSTPPTPTTDYWVTRIDK